MFFHSERLNISVHNDPCECVYKAWEKSAEIKGGIMRLDPASKKMHNT